MGIGDAETQSRGDAQTQSPEGCRNPIPGGVRKHHPRGCCGNTGICLKYAQGQKSFKGLPHATHCMDRAQNSGNVTPTVEFCPPRPTFRIKVRARRGVPEKKTGQLNVYIQGSPPGRGSLGEKTSGVSARVHLIFVFFPKKCCTEGWNSAANLAGIQHRRRLH